ncbi:hypothetical protein HDZ31DRAFT_44624 [Schizophyllum fasciatum]
MLSIDIAQTFHASRGIDEKGLQRAREEVLGTDVFALPDLISESWKELANLQTQLINASRKLYLAKAALEPVHSLPDDLLVHIFELVCTSLLTPETSEYDTLHSWKRLEQRTAPIVALSHVCCRWRRAAFQARTLWADIFLDHTQGLPCQRVESHLARSGSAPLCLTATIADSHYDDPRDPPYAASFAQYLEAVSTGHAARVAKVHVRVFDRLRPIFPRVRTPALRVLQLAVEQNKHVLGYQIEEYWRGRGAEQGPLLLDAPNLATLVLQGTGEGSFFPYMENLGGVGVPWATLTRMRMKGVYCTTRSAVAVLRACVALRECALAIDDTIDAVHGGFPTAPEWASVATVLVLPTLRTLDITWRRTVQEDLVGRLRCPNLEEMELMMNVWERMQNHDSYMPSFGQALLRFAHETALSRLRSLRVEGFGFPGDKDHPITPESSNRSVLLCSVLLRSLPALEVLHLSCRYDEGLLDALAETTDDGQPLLCPNLHQVELEFPYQPASEDLYARHLSMASRRWATPPKRRVRLCVLVRDVGEGQPSWKEIGMRNNVSILLASLKTIPNLDLYLPQGEVTTKGGFLSYTISNFLFL